MSEIKLEPRYPNSRHEDITDAYMRGYEAGYNDSAVHYELEHCPACKNIADLQEALEENAKLRETALYILHQRTMTTLDLITLIDGLVYCQEETDKYETDLIDGYEYIIGCEECPLVDKEGGCLLGERLRQYHEWKKSHEISL